MPMTVVVTRDVEARYRGFLSSVMLEIAPGVYTSPKLSVAVRNRIWVVLKSWFEQLNRGSIVLTWQDSKEIGGQGVLNLGEPPREILELDGVLVVRQKR